LDIVLCAGIDITKPIAAIKTWFLRDIEYSSVKSVAPSGCKLTKVHGYGARLFDQVNESFAFEIFDNISTWILLRDQPSKDLFFFVKITWKGGRLYYVYHDRIERSYRRK